MKRYFKVYASANNSFWTQKHDIMKDWEDAEWLEECETPEDVADYLYDIGYGVAPDYTLKTACDMLYDECDGDVDAALRRIEFDWGNDVGVYPLCSVAFDYTEQQDIFLKYIREFHLEKSK